MAKRKYRREIPPHDGIYGNPEYREIAGKLEQCAHCDHSSHECVTSGVCAKEAETSELDIPGVTDAELRDPFNQRRTDGGRVLPRIPQ